jgi:hypothetical protein
MQVRVTHGRVTMGSFVAARGWCARPVWDQNHALSPQEGTPPDYRRLIGFLEIDLLEKQ